MMPQPVRASKETERAAKKTCMFEVVSTRRTDMSDHPNAARYRAAHAAFASGDLESFRSMLADDVVWNTLGGDTIYGAEAVATSMSGLAGLDFDISLHDAIANDDHVIGLVDVHVTAGDKEISYRTAEIHHVDGEGKVTERWTFSDDTQAITDFFASLG
jgi:ketosteroid isomerase-like protein